MGNGSTLNGHLGFIMQHDLIFFLLLHNMQLSPLFSHFCLLVLRMIIWGAVPDMS